MGAAPQLLPDKLGLFSVIILGRPYQFCLVHPSGKLAGSIRRQLQCILRPALVAGKLRGYKHTSFRVGVSV